MADSIRERIIKDIVARAGEISLHEVVTGLGVVPGDSDKVAVAAGTCYLSGVLSTVAGNSALAITRSTNALKPRRYVSVIVTSAGVVSTVLGSVGLALIFTRGTGDGQMPVIPTGALEISMVSLTSIDPGVIGAGSITQIARFRDYKTNIGLTVTRSQKTHDEDTSKMVVVVPRQETTVKDRFGKMTHTMPVELLGAIRFNPITESLPELSEDIYSDLVAALSRPDDPFSTLIDEVAHIGGGAIEMPDNEEQYAGAVARFEIKYKTVLGHPETQ